MQSAIEDEQDEAHIAIAGGTAKKKRRKHVVAHRLEPTQPEPVSHRNRKKILLQEGEQPWTEEDRTVEDILKKMEELCVGEVRP